MNRQDILFLKILSDEQLATAFSIDASKYRSIEEGKKDLQNANVRAVAEIVEQVGKKISIAKSNMNAMREDGSVKLPPADFTPTYNTVLALLTK